MAGNPGAQLIGEMLAKMGENISDAMKFSILRKMEQQKIDMQGMEKIKNFMQLPVESRKMLLKNPDFLADMVRTLNPTGYGRKKPSAQGLAEGAAAAMRLGEETSTERTAREKAAAESAKAVAEQQLIQQKQRISSGVETPTFMSVLMQGDVKDPLAAALFLQATSTPAGAQQVKDLALFEKKGGPLQIQQQTQDLYKWAQGEGFPPGLAMKTAISLANGRWNEVPEVWEDPTTHKMIPVRAKAERELAVSTMNAVSRAREVQNTIENSIATSAAQLAEKAGLGLQEARANVLALREGKPIPFGTPHLAEMADLDKQIKQQEITKNAETILNDKYGIGVIRESMNSLLAAYKTESSIGLDSAKAKDLYDKIETTQQDLIARLAGRYNVQYTPYDENHPWSTAVKKAWWGVWNTAKASSAFTIDTINDLDAFRKKQLNEQAAAAIPGQKLVPAGRGLIIQSPPHTPEQEAILKSIYGSIGKALDDPTVPADQKEQLRRYMLNVLEPAYSDPSKFLSIFKPEQDFQ